MQKTAWSLGVLLLMALSAGCATDDSPTASPVGATILFGADIQPIFDGPAGCTNIGCHGNFFLGGLDLRANTSYASLVSVLSSQASIILVVPGKADSSFLVQKLEGTQGAGEGVQMPFGTLPLDVADIQTIRKWIDEGALDN